MTFRRPALRRVLAFVRVASAIAIVNALVHPPARAEDGAGSAAVEATDAAPWGAQLGPRDYPRVQRKSLLQPSSPVSQTPIQADAVADWAPQRFAPSGINPQSLDGLTPAPSDAVYLDSLSQASGPEVQPATLNTQTVAPADQIVTDPSELNPPDNGRGFIQKYFFTGTYLPAMSNEPDTLGFNDIEMGVIGALPLPRPDAPLLITPVFAAHILDNAGNFDLNPTLYDAAVEFRHLRKLKGPWAMDAAVATGYFSDMDHGSSEGVRVSGRALAIYERSPYTKWVMGVAYLNRAGATVLPVVGAVYEPSADVKWEFIFPRPRYYRRIGVTADGAERWIYAGGEFGGGLWSVTRPSTDQLDVLAYSDVRAVIGYERRMEGGFTPRFEMGYVFGRKIRFDSVDENLNLDDTMFARFGMIY
jgi:hypothetical protein